MSFKTTIDCYGPIEVEIDRDGKLTLHGYEEDYDIAITAMHGGESSLCQEILGEWDEYAWSVLGYKLGLSDTVLRLMSLDLIEYTIRSGTLDWAYLDDPRAEDSVAKNSAIAEQLVAATREYVEGVVPGTLGLDRVHSIYHEYQNAEWSLGSVIGTYGLDSWASMETLECFGQALYRACLAVGGPRPAFPLVAQSIRQATYPRYVGRSHRPDRVRAVDMRLWRWFIARFVDVMEDWQPGQPWPKIEEAS